MIISFDARVVLNAIIQSVWRILRSKNVDKIDHAAITNLVYSLHRFAIQLSQTRVFPESFILYALKNNKIRYNLQFNYHSGLLIVKSSSLPGETHFIRGIDFSHPWIRTR